MTQHRLLCARSKVLVYETMRDIARRMWDKWDLRLPRPPMSEVQPKPGRSAPGRTFRRDSRDAKALKVRGVAGFMSCL